MLRLHTFGGLRIELGGQPLRLPAQQTRNLLAHLILHHGRSLPRDLLIGTFWPDRPDSRARRALSQALWQIRTALGPAADRLEAKQDTVIFSLHPGDWLDIAEFVKKTHADSTPELDEATALYCADFLEDCHDDWALLERERLRELYLGTLERLIVIHKQQGAYEKALSNAQQLVAADPLRESAHQELMRLYHLLSRDHAALEQYATLRQTLAAELKAEPTAETTALAREIAARLDEDERPHLPAKAPTVPAFQQPELMPLIGREDERETLLAHLEAAIGGQGGLVLIEGEAGVGKTRLLQEIAHDAEWRGMQVGWGRGWELAELPAYEVLHEPLRTALSPSRADRLAELVDGIRLREACPVLPELADWLPNLPSQVARGTEQQRERLLEALAQIVLALGQIDPLLLILDDLQWADEATLTALAHLSSQLAGSHILIVCSYRSEEAREQPAVWQALEALDRAGGHHRLLLNRLTAEQTGKLVQRGLGLDARTFFEKQLYRETDGNPLFVLETLRALQDEGLLFQDKDGKWSSPWDEATNDRVELPLPSGILQVINRRLTQLDSGERALLEMAAVLGSDFDYALLVQAASLDRKVSLEAVNELVRKRFLVEEPAYYHFSHDKIRQAAYETIPAIERQRLHQQAGLALEALHPEQVEQLAHHFSLGQEWKKAVDYNRRAGERARSVYAGIEALGYYDRALEAWNHIEPTDERLGFDLYQERGGISQETGQFDRTEADFRTAYDLAERMGDQIGQAHALNHLSYLRFQRGDFDKAAEIAQQVLDLTAEARSSSEHATGLFNKANATRNSGDYETAIALYRRAVPLFEALDEQARLADCLNRMGGAFLISGRFTEARPSITRSLAIRRQLDDKIGISYSLINLSMISIYQGNFARAQETAQEALDISNAIGDPYGKDAALDNLAEAILNQGYPRQAIPLYQRSLKIAREIGDRSIEPVLLAGLGNAYHLLGDLGQAQAMLKQSLDAVAISTEQRYLPRPHLGLAQLLLTMNRKDEARVHAHAALRAVQKIDDPRVQGMTHRVFGQVASTIGSEKSKAEPVLHFEESIRILREIGAKAELARSLAAYGLYLKHLLDAEKAQHGSALLEEARALFQKLGMAWDLTQLEAGALTRLSPGQVRVRLPAISAPTGRPLRDDEYTAVTWTVAAPEDEEIPKKAPRRRHRLLRLLNQASDQSAAPTVPDLAEALGVSARTIERDLAALRAAGHEPRTRGGT